MTKPTRSLLASAMIMLTLVSCSWPGGNTKAELALATPTAAPTTIELIVKAEPSVLTAAGQVIKYTQVVKNAGAAAVPGTIAVTGANCPGINSVGNLDGAFDPGEVFTCTSEYVATQADLDKGSVTNITIATVSGISSNAITTTVSKAPSIALSLNKTANPTTYDKVGQIITYTYVILNSGTTTLGPVQFTITDTGFSAPLNCGEATASLTPNATLTCTASYTITQANLDAGSVSTNATASGGTATSQPVSVTVTKGAVPAPTNPNLTAGSTVSHKVISGEWIWQIARCYGADPKAVLKANPQLSNPAQISPNMIITVPNIGSAGKIYKTPDTPCVKTHKVVSTDTWNSIALMYNADLAVLQKVNSGTLVVGNDLLIPLNSAGSTTTSPALKVLTLATTANPATYNQAGQVITFTYVIKNSGTGNLGPAQFTVTDRLFGVAPFNCGAANTSLTPNATVTCSANYNITQTDLGAASLSNSATASGGGAGPSPSVSTTINKSIVMLTLTTMASPTTYNQVGQLIAFTYVIKNSGTGNLGPAQFTVTDSLISAAPFNCGAVNTTLAPNATVICSVNYSITQADLGAASLSNSATASGGGAGPSQSASVTLNKQ